MDIKEIKGIAHKLYNDSNEFVIFEPNQKIVGNWRHGDVDDWVTTDDGYVCQVLARSAIKHPAYKKSRTLIRTVCGSFVVEQKTHKMLGEHGIAENIYAFSGNNRAYNTFKKTNKLNNKEFLFARYIAKDYFSDTGIDAEKAYKKLFPKAQKEEYIKRKSSSLLKKENIRTMVKEEIQKILDEEEATTNWIIALYKDIASISERDSDRLRALDSLAKISGLFDTEKKQEQLTVWTGFTPEQLEAIGGKTTKLIAHGEKETEK